MPLDDDAFWDELGVSWRATAADTGLMTSRLEARLKLQSALLTTGTLGAAAISVLSLGLAAWALWIGWASQIWNFIARGMTLALVAVLATLVTLALRARNGAEARSLQDMLQVSITRTERLIRAADLTGYSLLILAIGGLVGYALRIRLGRPPAISPVEDLLALCLAGLALVWFRWEQARALRRYRHVRRAFDSGDEHG